jgi:(1->4)-alpha-D-glucan 1-alpha-D-glucosylmutase
LTARQDDPATLAEELLTHSADGRIKLWLTHRALIFRRQHPELFARGGYERVTVVGRKGINVVAYRRAWEESAAIAVAPRLVVRLTNGKEVPPIGTRVWADTWLVLPREAANRRYRDVFTGEELIPREGDAGPGLPLGEVLNRFPVALLERLG